MVISASSSAFWAIFEGDELWRVPINAPSSSDWDQCLDGSTAIKAGQIVAASDSVCVYVDPSNGDVKRFDHSAGTVTSYGNAKAMRQVALGGSTVGSAPAPWGLRDLDDKMALYREFTYGGSTVKAFVRYGDAIQDLSSAPLATNKVYYIDGGTVYEGDADTTGTVKYDGSEYYCDDFTGKVNTYALPGGKKAARLSANGNLWCVDDNDEAYYYDLSGGSAWKSVGTDVAYASADPADAEGCFVVETSDYTAIAYQYEGSGGGGKALPSPPISKKIRKKIGAPFLPKEEKGKPV